MATGDHVNPSMWEYEQDIPRPHRYKYVEPTGPIKTFTPGLIFPESTSADRGWICPKCGAVWSPLVCECWSCNKGG